MRKLSQNTNFIAWCGIVVLLILAGSVESYAQNGQNERISFNQANEASVGFDKLLNRYHWDTRLRYGADAGFLTFLLNQNFRSSLITTSRKFIRDEHTLGFDFSHPISSRFKGILKGSSYILSDDQNVALGKAGSHVATYGVEIAPVPELIMTPMLGWRFDDQIGLQDKGPVYSFGISSAGLESDGYGFTMGGYNEVASLSPRQLETFRDTLGVQKIFSEKTETEFSFSYLRHKREFYLTGLTGISGANIETRTEEALQFTGGIAYETGNDWSFAAHGVLVSRDVGRTASNSVVSQFQQSMLSPNIQEFRLEGDAIAHYTPSRSWAISSGIAMFEREERHSVEQEPENEQAAVDSALKIQERKNNIAKRTSLSVDVRFIPAYSDTFRLSFSNSILRYDTQSELNDDDRDELRHNIRLLTLHRINQYLHAEITAEASLTHLVYLTRFRSSENTWNRIFRLAPKLSYTPAHFFTTVNTFEVLANYTAYDFEYLTSSIRSFTFRQFAWVDSSTLMLTGRVGIDWTSALRLYERGELQWENFSEKPLTYIEERTLTGSVRYNIREHLLFSLGIRYFSQTRFAYAGADKQEEFFLRSVGPITAINWSVGVRTRLLVKGWYENLLQTGQMKSVNANMTLQCTVQL